jgi:hypothetical protein
MAQFRLVAQLDPSVTRLREIDTSDLAFSIDRNEMIEDLMFAVALRIEGVTVLAGKKRTLDVRKIWKVESTDRSTQKRAYRLSLHHKSRIETCFKSGDTFGVSGIVMNSRRGPGKGNRKMRTKSQLAAASKLGKRAASDAQKMAAKKIGLRAATDAQKKAAKKRGSKFGKEIGLRAASDAQKKAAKK